MEWNSASSRREVTYDHERLDVLEYRYNFLKRISAYEQRRTKYLGDDCEMATRPELNDQDHLLILIVQNESCFAAYEGQKTEWMLKDKTILKPKGSGCCLMVSEFLCECLGRLKLNDVLSKFPSKATMIIKPGVVAMNIRIMTIW